MCVLDNSNQKEKRELLYSEFKKNRRINEEISERQKKVELVNMQIKALQGKLTDIAFELDILQEIKDSQKTFMTIDKKIDLYLKSLKDDKALNVWKSTYSSDNGTSSTNMFSIKNATYTASIIVNHNKKRSFYRIDAELSLSSMLLGFAKEYKFKFQTINDVKIISTGKIFHTDTDVDSYINEIKENFKEFFLQEKAPIMREFKDVSNNKYTANDFIMYDDMLIDDYEITDRKIKLAEEEIPF